nr:hypothetical protein [Pandoravirus massiliensis]
MRRVGDVRAPAKVHHQSKVNKDANGHSDRGALAQDETSAHKCSLKRRRDASESDPPALAASPNGINDHDENASASQSERPRLCAAAGDDDHDDDDRCEDEATSRKKQRRQQDRRTQGLSDPSEGMLTDDDCDDLPLAHRWLCRMRKRLEIARCDAVWWQRAVRALQPVPAEAGGGLLLVSAILHGHPFATPYEELVKGVPDTVLGTIAWRATRLIFGLCVHPDGCGPVASRPEGTPAHPHADRVLRLALTLPPDHEERDADNNPVFTVGQVVHTISDLCGGRMAGRRLARFARLLARWYGNACAHWGEARESIECFIERRVLMATRTGCTAADLVAGRLRPCDWLAGAPGPVFDAHNLYVPNSDDDGGGVLPPYTEERHRAGGDGHEHGTGRVETVADKAFGVDETGAKGSTDNDHDRGAAEYRSDLQEAQRRRREAPSLRCVYDRIVCKQPAMGRGRPCLYIQSRMCAAEDRPDA